MIHLGLKAHRQIVQKVGVAGRNSGRTKIFEGFDERTAKNLPPNPCHQDPGGERIISSRHPFGEVKSGWEGVFFVIKSSE